MNEPYIKTAVRRDLHVHSLVTVHYFEYAKDYRFGGEAHPFWELVYVDKGEVDATSDERLHHLTQGDILFHKPNEFHTLRANGVKAPNLIVIAFRVHAERDMYDYNDILGEPAGDSLDVQVVQDDTVCPICGKNRLFPVVSVKKLCELVVPARTHILGRCSVRRP